MNRDRISRDYRLEHRVRDEDSARHWANDLPVFATPVLLWLAEVAAMRAIDPALDPGEMSVGTAHDSKHLRPSLVGAQVQIHAECIAVTGRRVTFSVTAWDGHRVVFTGTHERAVISRASFLAELGIDPVELTAGETEGGAP